MINLPTPPAWTLQAVCASVDPELFFPEKGGSTRAATRICQTCPVINECLQTALDHGDRHGIWGGTSEHQRRAIHHSTKPWRVGGKVSARVETIGTETTPAGAATLNTGSNHDDTLREAS